FIADSWFSDEPLPVAYTHPTADRVRETGGVSAKEVDRDAVRAYIAAVDIPGAITELKGESAKFGGLRGEYLAGLVLCFETMWALVMEIMGSGDAVPYEACVKASTGKAPEPSDPSEKREHVTELLSNAGFASK